MEAPMCGTDSREQKHLMLDRAIRDLSEVKSHIEDVLQSINGGQSNPKNKICSDKPMQPTLQSVLEEGPRQINSIASDVHELLDQIKSALF